MKRIWVLIGSFVLSAPARASANAEGDKAAAHEASSEADQWASKKADKPTAAAEVAPPVDSPAADGGKGNTTESATKETSDKKTPGEPPATPSSPAPAANPETPAPAKKTAVSHHGINEMKGKLMSVSTDPGTLRLMTDGGFNVEFSYDQKTSVINGGEPVSLEDLNYNDGLIVRYEGKDLYAVEIERVSKAPRPQ
jgi:hypothetical protein